VLNVIDGCIPSDMAVGSREQTEEERRLMYVAMTRAREHLRLVHPLRLYRSDQHRYGDGHVLAQRTQLHFPTAFSIISSAEPRVGPIKLVARQLSQRSGSTWPPECGRCGIKRALFFRQGRRVEEKAHKSARLRAFAAGVELDGRRRRPRYAVGCDQL